jgi:hypothetical protein
MPPTASPTRETPLRSSAPHPASPSQISPKHLRRPFDVPRPADLRHASDDEILGLDSAQTQNPSAEITSGATLPDDAPDDTASSSTSSPSSDASNPSSQSSASPESFAPELSDASRAALEANPELRQAWHDREAYRSAFATPSEARAATAVLQDIDRLDALFFSRKPEDHAQLASVIARMDPAAFASLAQAMQRLAVESNAGVQIPMAPSPSRNVIPNPAPISPVGDGGEVNPPSRGSAVAARLNSSGLAPSQSQSDFFHATNAAAVESVLGAIHSQVEKLLPEGVSKNARDRVVGEIYRELDSTLRSNRQLSQQLREAFRSGSLDPDHQRAIVSLLTGRARQALPAVAKRVLNEWTSTIVAANQDRRNRQRAAERRIDIAGSSGAGNDARRPMSPREIDYSRMSDADILNL